MGALRSAWPRVRARADRRPVYGGYGTMRAFYITGASLARGESRGVNSLKNHRAANVRSAGPPAPRTRVRTQPRAAAARTPAAGPGIGAGRVAREPRERATAGRGHRLPPVSWARRDAATSRESSIVVGRASALATCLLEQQDSGTAAASGRPRAPSRRRREARACRDSTRAYARASGTRR